MKKNNLKILCVFGKYQYGNKNRGLSTEYFSFVPAMKKLGYEIVFFDSWDKSLYNNFIELNNNLISIVKKENPNIIFSVQLGYEIWLETWDYIRSNFTCKTINWCTDDSWKYREHSKFLALHFDLMVTTYESFLIKYKSQNANAILSSWAIPIDWIQKPKKATHCKYKVSFVGAAHGDRKIKIQKLIDNGIEVVCFGYGWDNGAIRDDEIPKIFNDSVISLNFANSSGENQIKARVFEVTGSGGFLLSENAKNLDKVLDSSEIKIFDSMDNCIKSINYYLDNLDLRDNIAIRGFKKTSEHYAYTNRLQEIFNVLRKVKKNTTVLVNFSTIVNKHKKNIILYYCAKVLLLIGKLLYGKSKGARFARRVVYEFSWRVFRENTYRSKGIVGRMFYNE